MKLLITLLLFTITSDWALEYNENNIAVYTRDAAHSEYKEAKAVTMVSAQQDELIELLYNVDAYKNIVHNCQSASFVRKMDDGFLAYLTFDAPWPLDDRDVAIYFAIQKMNDGNTKISMNKYESFAAKEDYVRVKELDGYWILSPAGSGTKIEFQLYMDPGGNVPSFLVNKKADDQVYETLLNLRKRFN